MLLETKLPSPEMSLSTLKFIRLPGLVSGSILLAIIVGQLIKLPLGGSGGPAVLDMVVLLLDAILLFRYKFKFPKPPIFVKPAAVFIIIAIISLLNSPLNLTNTERLVGFFYTVRFSSIILLGWLLVIPKKAGIQNMLLLSGVILSILGLLQFIFIPDLGFLAPAGWDYHYFRTVSTFLDPNFLGAYLVLTLLLFSSLRDHEMAKQSFKWTRLPRRLRLLAMTTVYLALLTTFSRGSYLAFLVAFLTLSILKKSLKLGIITILLFALLMISFMAYHRGIAEPRGVDRGQSAEARLDTWQQGLQMFLQQPILGVGFNVYRVALKEYQLSDEGFLTSHGAGSNDSSLLFVAATTGIIGFIAYCFFLASIAWQGFKKNLILLAGLIGLLAQSFFANTLFYPYILLWLVLNLCYHEEHE